MARNFQLLELEELCKQQCDEEGQDSISPAEWRRYVSSVYAQLYKKFAFSGLRYFEDTLALTAQSTPLPDDHLSTLGIDWIIDATTDRRKPLREISYQQRWRYIGRGASRSLVYEHAGANLVLHPPPQADQDYELLYIPQPPILTSAGDETVIDVITPDGEDFVIWNVVVAAKEKLDRDTKAAERQAARAEERIDEDVRQRSLHYMAEPEIEGEPEEDEVGNIFGW
jgi:hypothetical protein